MKEYKRNCPKCNKHLFYKSKNKLCKANSKNTLCKKCRIEKTKNKKLNEQYIKNCPICNKEMKYKRKGALTLSIKLNSPCRPCSTKINWSNNKYKHNFTEEHRKNISISHKKSKIFQAVMKSELYRGKAAEAMKRRGVFAQYNKRACEFFTKLNYIMGWDGFHAENKGEHTIGRYWIDYYEPSVNLVIEWDEPRHYTDKKYIDKDLKKQKFIIEKLNCKFLRINEKTKEVYEIN